MSSPRLSYTPRSDTASRAELNALAAVYRYILDCRAKKEAAPESRPEDAKESVNARAYTKYTG